MAENGREILEQSKTSDKESKLRVLKERQNEERQRKLEEIKAQAFAAQKFKEQKEQERRKRLEEWRMKDDARRQQVEEKKKAINDAERSRLEFIIKRNQEREQRMEAKRKNEKSNAVFAFGSSTPRMLEPADVTISFWGARRATSIQNITCSSASTSLTRRQSERDLDIGNKKRATSATGLERSAEITPTVPAGCASGYQGRRRTDLVPTIPSRDASFISSRKSLNHSPGRAYSMTRLDQLAKSRKRHDLPSLEEGNSLSSSRVNSVTRSMSHLAVSKTGLHTSRKLNKVDSRSMHHLTDGGAVIVPRTTRTTQLREQKLLVSSNCSEASSRPSSSLSQQSTNSVTSSVSLRHRLSTTPRKPRPASIAVTGISHESKNSEKLGENKPPLPKLRKSIGKTNEKEKITVKSKPKTCLDNPQDKLSNATNEEPQQRPPDTAPVIQQIKEVVPLEKENEKRDLDNENVTDTVKNNVEFVPRNNVEENKIDGPKIGGYEETKKENISEISQDAKPEISQEMKQKGNEIEVNQDVRYKLKTETLLKTENESLMEPSEVEKSDIESKESNMNNEMTSSITKIRISTEEEAKAAIAERRRLIREEAERQAELERQRLEAEAKAEFERQQREEEQIRQLIELQRHTEQERLKEAIREAQKREEEERLRREEEQRLKLLKEEAERKAKEDADRQKAELQERLRNEEKEREARRKRVEAIMLRTRGKNNANLTSQQSADDKNENKFEENKVDVESKVNGTKIEQQENGTTESNNKSEIVDNIIQDEIIKNANTIDTNNRTDALNSNNTWRDSQEYDSLM